MHCGMCVHVAHAYGVLLAQCDNGVPQLMTTRKIVTRGSLNHHIFTYHQTSSFTVKAIHLFMLVHADIVHDPMQIEVSC